MSANSNPKPAPEAEPSDAELAIALAYLAGRVGRAEAMKILDLDRAAFDRALRGGRLRMPHALAARDNLLAALRANECAHAIVAAGDRK